MSFFNVTDWFLVVLNNLLKNFSLNYYSVIAIKYMSFTLNLNDWLLLELELMSPDSFFCDIIYHFIFSCGYHDD